MSEPLTVSFGRDLCVCEECRKKVTSPDALIECDGDLSPYPETIRLCEECAEDLYRARKAEREAEYGPDDLRCHECGGNARDGYDCPLAKTYPPGECRFITGVW